MARLAEPAVREPVRLAVVADPHLETRLTGTAKRYERTEAVLRRTLADIDRRNVDLAASVGDLTREGAAYNFERFDELLEELETPFVAVPGNHDVPKEGDDHDVPGLSRFVERYTPGRLPFHERVGSVDLLGLNTVVAPDGRLSASADGAVPPADREWLAGTLAAAPAPVVLVHQNLPGVIGQFRRYCTAVDSTRGPHSAIRDPEPLLSTLEAGGARLVLSGHIHVPAVARAHGVREVAAPPLCLFPNAYLLLDVDERGTTVRFVPVLDRAESRSAYVAATRSERRREKIDVTAINLGQFPVREEWTPEGAGTDSEVG